MSDAPQPVTAEVTRARYEAIVSKLTTTDQTARRIRGRIDKLDLRITELTHQRDLEVVAMQHHMRSIRRMAADLLAEELGVKVLPGVQQTLETKNAWRARMRNRRKALEQELSGEIRPLA